VLAIAVRLDHRKDHWRCTMFRLLGPSRRPRATAPTLDSRWSIAARQQRTSAHSAPATRPPHSQATTAATTARAAPDPSR
jgi:hypothetical protein